LAHPILLWGPLRPSVDLFPPFPLAAQGSTVLQSPVRRGPLKYRACGPECKVGFACRGMPMGPCLAARETYRAFMVVVARPLG